MWAKRARANALIHLPAVLFAILVGVVCWPLTADLQEEWPFLPWLLGLYVLVLLTADYLNVSTLLRMARRAETGQNLIQAKRGLWLFREKQFARMLSRPEQTLFTRFDTVMFAVLALGLSFGGGWLWLHRSTPPERQHRTALGHADLLNYRGEVTQIEIGGNRVEEKVTVSSDQRSATSRVRYGKDWLSRTRYRVVSGPTNPQGKERTIVEVQDIKPNGTSQTIQYTLEGSCLIKVQLAEGKRKRTCDALGRPLTEKSLRRSATYRYVPLLPVALARFEQQFQTYATNPPTWEWMKSREILLLQPDGEAISQQLSGSKVTRKLDRQGNWIEQKHESIQMTTGQPEVNLTVRRITYR